MDTPKLHPLITILADASTQVSLPEKPFPIGCPDIKETRTINELRPGLTHVHVKRGSWGPAGRPKLALTHETENQVESEEARAGLEKFGLKVRQQTVKDAKESKTKYRLIAGEFTTESEAIQVARRAPVPIGLTSLDNHEKGSGPYVFDIVILDPKKYRGKIITAWSECIWRASPLELALKHNAVVATNGSWFEYSIDNVAGIPSGISIVEGMWHHEHPAAEHRPESIISIVERRQKRYKPSTESKHHAILFIENTPEGPKLSIGYAPPPLPELKWGKGKSVILDGIDRMPKPNSNEIVALRAEIFYHSQFSHGHPTETHSIRMINEASSGIGLVLLATGDKRKILEETQSSWDEVVLDLSIPGRQGLNALYSYNVLIENGRRPTILDRNGSTARTAIGADAGGKIYLMSFSVDTPQYDSQGATLSELQDIGEFLGLVNFVNMDGGPRSTSMVIEGRVLGDPHMQPYSESRRVGDTILIKDEE